MRVYEVVGTWKGGGCKKVGVVGVLLSSLVLLGTFLWVRSLGAWVQRERGCAWVSVGARCEERGCVGAWAVRVQQASGLFVVQGGADKGVHAKLPFQDMPRRASASSCVPRISPPNKSRSMLKRASKDGFPPFSPSVSLSALGNIPGPLCSLRQ